MTIRETLIQELLSEHAELRRVGFIRAIKAEIPHPAGGTIGDVDNEYGLRVPGLRPAAFAINHTDKFVVAFEVEVFSRVNRTKFNLYYDLMLLLDECDYTFGVMLVSATGDRKLANLGEIGVCLTLEEDGQGEADISDPTAPRFLRFPSEPPPTAPKGRYGKRRVVYQKATNRHP